MWEENLFFYQFGRIFAIDYYTFKHCWWSTAICERSERHKVNLPAYEWNGIWLRHQSFFGATILNWICCGEKLNFKINLWLQRRENRNKWFLVFFIDVRAITRILTHHILSLRRSQFVIRGETKPNKQKQTMNRLQLRLNLRMEIMMTHQFKIRWDAMIQRFIFFREQERSWLGWIMTTSIGENTFEVLR